MHAGASYPRAALADTYGPHIVRPNAVALHGRVGPSAGDLPECRDVRAAPPLTFRGAVVQPRRARVRPRSPALRRLRERRDRGVRRAWPTAREARPGRAGAQRAHGGVDPRTHLVYFPLERDRGGRPELRIVAPTARWARRLAGAGRRTRFASRVSDAGPARALRPRPPPRTPVAPARRARAALPHHGSSPPSSVVGPGDQRKPNSGGRTTTTVAAHTAKTGR